MLCSTGRICFVLLAGLRGARKDKLRLAGAASAGSFVEGRPRGCPETLGVDVLSLSRSGCYGACVLRG